MSKISVDRKKLIVALKAAKRGAYDLDGFLCGIDACILEEEDVIVERIEEDFKKCINTLKALIDSPSSGPTK